MSNFGGKSHDTTEKAFGPSQFLSVGNQRLCITDFEIKKASTGSQQVKFKVESPCTEEGFEPHADAKRGGRIATINFSSYIKEGNEVAVTELEKDLQIVAEKLGVKEQVAALTGTSLEDYIAKVVALISNQYFWLSVTGEEYFREGKAPGVALGRRRFGFAASLAEGESHLRPFDKTNVYDYKKLAVADNEPAKLKAATDDLPW